MLPRSFAWIKCLILLLIIQSFKSQAVIIGNETMVPETEIPKSPPIIIINQINSTSNNKTI